MDSDTITVTMRELDKLRVIQPVTERRLRQGKPQSPWAVNQPNIGQLAANGILPTQGMKNALTEELA